MKVLVMRDKSNNVVFDVAYSDAFLASFEVASLDIQHTQLEQLTVQLYEAYKNKNPHAIIVTDLRPSEQSGYIKIVCSVDGARSTHLFALANTPSIYHFQHAERFLNLNGLFHEDLGLLVRVFKKPSLRSQFDRLVNEKEECLSLLNELSEQVESLEADKKETLKKFIARQRSEMRNLFSPVNGNDYDHEDIRKGLVQDNIYSFARKIILVALYNVAAELYYNYVVDTNDADEKRDAFFKCFSPFGFVSLDKRLLSFKQVRGNDAELDVQTAFQTLAGDKRTNSNFSNIINALLAKIDSTNWTSSWIFSDPMRPMVEAALVEAVGYIDAETQKYSNSCPFGIEIDGDAQSLKVRADYVPYVFDDAYFSERFTQISTVFEARSINYKAKLLAISEGKSMPSSPASSLASSSEMAKHDIAVSPSPSPSPVTLASSSSSESSCSIPQSQSEDSMLDMPPRKHSASSQMRGSQSFDDIVRRATPGFRRKRKERLAKREIGLMENVKLHFFTSTWVRKGVLGLDFVNATFADKSTLPDSIKKIKSVLEDTFLLAEEQWIRVKAIAQQAIATGNSRRCPTTSDYLNLLAGNDEEAIKVYFSEQAKILRDKGAMRKLLLQVKEIIEQTDWMKPAGSFYPIQVDTGVAVQEKYVPKHAAVMHGILRAHLAKPESLTEFDDLSVFQQVEKIAVRADLNHHRYRDERVSSFYSIFSQPKANLSILLAEQQDYIDRNKACLNELTDLHRYIRETMWEVHSWRSVVGNFLSGNQYLDRGDRWICLNQRLGKPDYLPDGIKEQYLLIEALLNNKSKYDALTVFAKVQEIAIKKNNQPSKYRLKDVADYYNDLLAVKNPEDIGKKIINRVSA